jgi:hypothetical protein
MRGEGLSVAEEIEWFVGMASQRHQACLVDAQRSGSTQIWGSFRGSGHIQQDISDGHMRDGSADLGGYGA